MLTAIVIGRARGVWEEVAALQVMVEFDATIVVGQAAVDYPGKIDHWVTFHSNLFGAWASKRRARGFPEPVNVWGPIYKGRAIKKKREVEYPGLRRIVCNGGSSGMLGVNVALHEVKADRIALAGIPMQDVRGHYDEGAKDWDEADKYKKVWIENVHQMNGRVRSMSGWTMDLLGGEPPTRGWFLGEE